MDRGKYVDVVFVLQTGLEQIVVLGFFPKKKKSGRNWPWANHWQMKD